jgi:two-component system chemotaxis response regulator CheB
LPALPANFPLPVLVVQHMPEIFTRHLAERLDTRCQLQVCEAVSGQTVRAGQVYIAKGNWHLEVRRVAPPTAISSLTRHPASRPTRHPVHSVIRLTQDPMENHCRPAVDVLFRSGLAAYGPGTLAVVLTGMGSDGLAGCRLIREQGGVVLAQDEATSSVWGMPGVVAQAGLANNVLPLSAIAPEILRLVSLAQWNREKPSSFQHEALELRDSAGRH